MCQIIVRKYYIYSSLRDLLLIATLLISLFALVLVRILLFFHLTLFLHSFLDLRQPLHFLNCQGFPIIRLGSSSKEDEDEGDIVDDGTIFFSPTSIGLFHEGFTCIFEPVLLVVGDN